MSEPGLHLFDTPVGRCGMVWTTRGIRALRLPEADDRRTAERLKRSVPAAREAPPPDAIADVVERIVALLEGGRDDLTDVALDTTGVPAFALEVYAVARTVAPGDTITYGEIARRVGEPDAARDVGQALGLNPFPIVVPCHRVVAAGGRMGGFSATGGVATKRRLLALEQGQRALFDP